MQEDDDVGLGVRARRVCEALAALRQELNDDGAAGTQLRHFFERWWRNKARSGCTTYLPTQESGTDRVDQVSLQTTPRTKVDLGLIEKVQNRRKKRNEILVGT